MSDYTPPNNNNQPRRRAPQQATRRRNTDNYNNDSFDEQPRNANRGNNRNYQDEYEERTPQRRAPNPQQQNRRNYNDDDDYYDEQPRRTRANNYPPRAEKSNKGLLYGLGAIAAVAVAAGSYFAFKAPDTAQIVAVSPNYITTQQAYQDCHRVGTTRYVKNQKNGTEGALIGGATGAVAGGIIGNQVHGGGGGTAVGAVAGGVGGALIGREIQRSNQPDYVAKHGSSTQCQTAYRPVQTQSGYNVQYLYKDNMANIVTQTAPAIGTKIPMKNLQQMAMPAQATGANPPTTSQ
ncbi:MAG: glycine zipper 2TM domain-containing protein [Neisseriaceae bacterium]|nr:MAG: glycine zipper 2TM domain-containing protein [Neisseriaceae bacterium]